MYNAYRARAASIASDASNAIRFILMTIHLQSEYSPEILSLRTALTGELSNMPPLSYAKVNLRRRRLGSVHATASEAFTPGSGSCSVAGLLGPLLPGSPCVDAYA